MEKGVEKGLAEGIEKGRKDEKITMARKLKAMGVLSDEQIAAATGLTIDEIKNL